MDNLKYHRKTTFVGVIDVIISCLGIVATISIAGLNVIFKDENRFQIDDTKSPIDISKVICILVEMKWALLGVQTPFFGLLMYGASQLVLSTEVGKKASESIKMAQRWMYVNIFLFYMSLSVAFYLIGYVHCYALIFILVIRAASTYIVWQYIEELGRAIVFNGRDAVATTGYNYNSRYSRYNNMIRENQYTVGSLWAAYLAYKVYSIYNNVQKL